MKARHFHPGMGQAVAERTILRKDRDGKFETWADVARRVAKGNTLLCNSEEDRQAEYDKMHEHLAKVTLLMSGRHLQHGDETQPERTMEVFTNCSSSSSSFMLFYLLMSGSGVGRCYDDDLMLVNYDNAPNILCVLDEYHKDFNYNHHHSLREAKHRFGKSENVIWFDVPDNREGWAKAVEVYETLTYEGTHKDKLLILNFSPVRCKGTPIGGMQGRPASGPGPLMYAFEKAASIKNANLDPWFQAMHVDHCFAECVLVGGARRAARMSVKFWKDRNVVDFINVKRPIEYYGKTLEEITEIRKTQKPLSFLWSSNNSILVDQEFWTLLGLSPDDDGYHGEDANHARLVFKAASEAAYADGTGEPGFINVDKLVQNKEGFEEILKGEYVGSEKYQVDETTNHYLRQMAKATKNKPYYTIVNPCSEIAFILLGAFCVIADLVPFFADTLDEIEDSFRTATRSLIRVNTMDSVYKKEVQRTNRIGVAITGIHEFAWKFFGYNFHDLINEEKSKDFWLTMSRFARAVHDEAEAYSKIHNLPFPHTLRTIKPSGTVSKLWGLTEGWHLPSMAWYLRWVQFSETDPLVETYARAGYPTRKLTQYKNTTIVGFPTKLAICDLMPADKIVYAGDATPEQQYQWLKLGEKYWIECVNEDGSSRPERGNQISYTLKYDPTKVSFEDFARSLREQQSQVRCCSVMPQEDSSAYEYLPEEAISKEIYDAIVAQIEAAKSQEEVLDLVEDIGKEHLECENGACPIDFKKDK
jgi:adenosylcobalamin-dependent ribonucleoside-triphosphate reductase